ncbi:hypothetical protein PILCRDRAFT_421619 [Piloderma croceum F 1598]|uniref:Uncharacterized protein n=1 Tax=Piloderma croceum (strain F 1598) TaxID=765440 RepID=A0A0C3G077_PILCF|nr:hypothetical protein PILCRDRAFT_421619 [Piloderma croceum F 1598]
MPNNGMPRNQQFPGQASGATSPSNQQSMPQQHQQPQQPQNGGFPFGPNQMNPGANVSNSQMLGAHQQQQMRAGGSGNPAMMNPDAYAMVQERARQEQQQRMSQANSPANAGSPPMSSSFGNDTNNFPALRSNSTIPGIARSTRSPSDGAPSPMSPQMPRGTQDMRRMMDPSMGRGGMGQIPGFNQQMPNWQQKNQLGQQQQSMSMGQLQPTNYGLPQGTGGNSFGGGQNWGTNQYPMASSPNSGGVYQDQTMISRQSSSTPAPQMQGSPPPQQTLQNEFEMFNWGGGSQ